jgi:hypothetical protein
MEENDQREPAADDPPGRAASDDVAAASAALGTSNLNVPAPDQPDIAQPPTAANLAEAPAQVAGTTGIDWLVLKLDEPAVPAEPRPRYRLFSPGQAALAGFWEDRSPEASSQPSACGGSVAVRWRLWLSRRGLYCSLSGWASAW